MSFVYLSDCINVYIETSELVFLYYSWADLSLIHFSVDLKGPTGRNNSGYNVTAIFFLSKKAKTLVISGKLLDILLLHRTVHIVASKKLARPKT